MGTVEIETEVVPENVESEQVTELPDVPDAGNTPSSSTIAPTQAFLDIPEVSHSELNSLNTNVGLTASQGEQGKTTG